MWKNGNNVGEKNPRWKGGRYKASNGYIMVKAYGHPKAYRNEIMEHRLVMEQTLGRHLTSSEKVHHINGIKDDNRIENLVLCQNDKEHLYHHRLKSWALHYDKCLGCGTTTVWHKAKGYCKYCYNTYHKEDT